jgi:hypothetical protein
MAKVVVDGRPLPELLGPVLDWRFNLSSQQLRRGLVYTGAGTRWAAAAPGCDTATRL